MRFRRRLRSQIEDARRGNDFYADMAQKPRLDYSTALKPKRERAPTVRDVNAPPLERDVLKAVWKLLSHHPKVAWCTRINSGSLMADFGTSGIHPMRLNYKRGISDLIGQLRDGRFLAVECKREGASLMDHQRDFLNEVRKHHGVAFVARCLEDVERNIDAPLNWPLP
jgi:hypothetical protein